VFAKRVAPRVERWLPAAWSANGVTLLGSGLMWLMLAGVVSCPAPLRVRLGPLWIALLWGYCLLDHVDGCRARRRGSSSAWGEFLDHALDAWHGTIVVVVAAMMGGSAVHPGLVVAAIASVGLATTVTWMEQNLRGEFVLGALGPVEAVLGAGIFIGLWSWPEAARILGSPVMSGGGWTWADLAFALAAAGNLITAALVIWRNPGAAAPLGMVALVVGLVVGLGGNTQIGWLVAGAAIAILTAEYSARIIVSHLTGAPIPWPDVMGPALPGMAVILPRETPALAFVALVWLGARAVTSWRAARCALRT
jgi:phosphatidylglycerophosphate synthase